VGSPTIYSGMCSPKIREQPTKSTAVPDTKHSSLPVMPKKPKHAAMPYVIVITSLLAQDLSNDECRTSRDDVVVSIFHLLVSAQRTVLTDRHSSTQHDANRKSPACIVAASMYDNTILITNESGTF
jgi:hypothetical protein